MLPLLPPSGCLTLVTSRQHFNLPGLAAQDLDTLAPRDARGLIRKIAKGVKAEEADSIARQCGYLPLALRLAAGMLNTRPDWTPADLVGKLQDALRLLEPLEASLQLSYGLLDDGCKLAFRLLGIFPASFDREAAGAVWESAENETDRLLGQLLGASLLAYERDSDRYALHDLVGAFARAQWNETEKETASRRHAGHYLQVLSQANALYKQGGAAILAGLALYDREAGAYPGRAELGSGKRPGSWQTNIRMQVFTCWTCA